MALSGEIQEPPALKFRADSLHSGSISFGRFEAESLSWERRSSFSHNRHLEELERYSKPGSVTEKAAYFEAHFRRKALLSQSSSECQNGTDYHTSENDESENMVFRDELEHSDEGNHLILFDKSSVGSDSGVESEVMQYGREALGTPHIEPVVASNVSDGSGSMQGGFEHINSEEVHQNETDRFPVIDAELGRKVREESHDEAVNMDLSLSIKATNLTTDNHTTTMHDSARLEHYGESSPEVGGVTIGKQNCEGQTKVSWQHYSGSKKCSSELRKVDAKKPTRIKREGSWTTKSEKQSLQMATPIIRSVHRTSKPEVSKSSKLKVVHANKSEKELNSTKIVEPKPSVSDKVVPKAQQTTNRPKLTENSAKPGMKQTSAVYNLARDQLAERRKEEKEAEVKELRKSLNFRARPMPSFYHAAVQHDSHKQEDQSLASNSCFLPEDVVTDQILSRLPVKSLMRFKIVCKRWHALITTPSFIASHLKYIGTPNRLVCWNAKNDGLIVGDDAFHVFTEIGFTPNFQPVNLNFGFDRKPDFVLGPCDGIYCLYWRVDDEYSHEFGITVANFERLPTIALWNPATRSFSILPMSKFDFPPYRRVTYCMVGFGCDLITKSIKVVKVLGFPNPPYINHAEVYDLVSGSWRVLHLDDILQEVIVDDSLMRSIYNKNDGVFHWHTRLRDCSDGYDEIVLSFDMSTELFHVTLLPEKYRGFRRFLTFRWKDFSFALLRDSLAVICSFFHQKWYYTTVEAWVMEKDFDCVVEAGKSSSSYRWSHEFTVELPFPGPCVSKGFWNGNELLIWKDFDLSKWVSGRSPFLYDIVTKQARDLEISGELNFIYRESLVSVKGGRGDD